MEAQEIMQRRQALNMSATEFGVALGMTGKSARITVWRWESNKTKPSPQTIALMKKLRTRKQRTQ